MLEDDEELSEEEQKKRQEEQFNQLNILLTPYIDEVSNQVVNKVIGSITEANKSLRTLNANATKEERQLIKNIQDVDFESFIELHPQGELIQLAIDQGLVPKAWIKSIKKNPVMLEIFLPRIQPYLEKIEGELSKLKDNGQTGQTISGYQHPYADQYK